MPAAQFDSQILTTPIEYLKGVGPIKGDLLRKELGITCYGDLLLHFPFRYIDKSIFTKINEFLLDGKSYQTIGRIIHVEVVEKGYQKRLVATLKDDTGEIELVWFQGIAGLKTLILIGEIFVAYGKPSLYNGSVSITHPEIDKWDPRNKPSGFEPVYSSTEKLKNKYLHSKGIYQIIKSLLPLLQKTDFQEFIPQEILVQRKLPLRIVAIIHIHSPQNNQAHLQAHLRFKYEELFIYQLLVCKQKLLKSRILGHRFTKIGDFFNGFYKLHLPFSLTEDQKNVIKEIRDSMNSGFQMNRLLQGDVGSGKTIVALLCQLIALDNGFQSCLVAPTEILAQQHFATINELLKPLDIQCGLLTGNIKGKERKEILAQLENGSLHMLIGTHAVLEEKVIFKNLGLAIIDEQHRFGVAQRASLWKKASTPPHILVMTATPIPRTLAMSVYGDLEVSTIKHLPPGRQPITTIHKADSYRLKVLEFVKQQVTEGRQAYIVFPLIEESEKLDYENLMAGISHIQLFFPQDRYNISVVHGRQSLAEREMNMSRFINGTTQIMIATTVIEVGVNVPNASIMVIESAERFGLSQLHQLRGRIGRGAYKSYCVLLSGNKLSKDGLERMNTMVQESNGFKISEKDLQLRGPGNIYGTQQSGEVPFKLVNLATDFDILQQAREDAITLLQQDPDLVNHPKLKQELMKNKNYTKWSNIS
jgi:ATP-dependent DNA helicase RecG